jgi:hypothetical protein
MTSRTRAAALALAAMSLLAPVAASAACSTTDSGARCIRVAPTEPEVTALRPQALDEMGAMSSASASTPLFDVGDVVPRGEYSIILNADYYGLPPVSDGWVYMRVGQDAFRVDWQTHEVLERVTDETAQTF